MTNRRPGESRPAAKSRQAGGTYRRGGRCQSGQRRQVRPLGRQFVTGHKPPVEPGGRVPPARRRVRGWSVGRLVLLAAIGVVGFYWTKGPASLRQAPDRRRQLPGRRPCCGRCRARRCFHGRETDYLLAVAVLRQYAAAPDARHLPDNLHVRARAAACLVLQAAPKWRDRAKRIT